MAKLMEEGDGERDGGWRQLREQREEGQGWASGLEGEGHGCQTSRQADVGGSYPHRTGGQINAAEVRGRA